MSGKSAPMSTPHDDVDISEAISPLVAIRKKITKFAEELADLMVADETPENEKRCQFLMGRIKKFNAFLREEEPVVGGGTRHASRGVPFALAIAANDPGSTSSVGVGQSNVAFAQMIPRSSTPEPKSSEVDMSPNMPGVVVKSKGQLKVSLEMDHDFVPLKRLKLHGNNLFYQHLQDKAFSLFAPTIRTSYRLQNKGLKNDLMQHMMNLFGPIFNQKMVQTMAGKYIKTVRDNYRINIGKYPNYERPLLIPEREWDALVEDAKEKKMRKEGTLPPSALETPRLKDTTKATQARVDKIGQHKLGPGGYVKVKGRYAADFGSMPTNEELKVALKGGYNALVEMKKSNATNTSTVNEEAVQEYLDVSQEPFLETERIAQPKVTPTAPAGIHVQHKCN